MNYLMLGLRLAPFLILTGAPLFLTRWLCARMAAVQQQGDPAAGWFGYARATGLLTSCLWFSWLVGVLLLDPWRSLAGAFAWNEVGTIAFHNALTVMAPGLILAACEVMAFPVVQQLRGWDLRFKEVALDAFMGRLWLTLPATLLWIGFRAVPTGKSGAVTAPLVCMLAGILTLLAMQFFWWRPRVKRTFTRHAVSVGPLRDRAFALAEKAGVKLGQVYVMPMARWRLANAFASEGNTLLLTDWLLRHLTVPEVDAVIAHELAHMKHKHLSKQGWIVAPFWIVVMVWFPLRGEVPDLAWVALWAVAATKASAAALALVSRRHERQADLDSLAINHDPAALASALIRLDQLNLTPHELGELEEQFSTHPSTRKRIEAIGAAAGLSVEEFKVPGPLREETNRYLLPESVEAATQGDGPIYDTSKRNQISARFTWAYVLAVGLLPPLLAWASVWLPANMRWLGYAIGLSVYVGMILLVTDRAGRGWHTRLRAKIRQRVCKDLANENNAIFVGLSPGPEVRTYDGCYDWDLGFLSFEPGQLCYRGEQTQFALRREQILQVRLGPGAPRLLPTRGLFVDWFDSERGQEGTFCLYCAGHNSFYADGKDCLQLAASIERWRSESSPSAMLSASASAADLPSPQFGEVTGISVGEARGASQFLLSLLIVIVPACGLMNMLELARRSFAAMGYGLLLVIGGQLLVMWPTWRRGRKQRLPSSDRASTTYGLLPRR